MGVADLRPGADSATAGQTTVGRMSVVRSPVARVAVFDGLVVALAGHRHGLPRRALAGSPLPGRLGPGRRGAARRAHAGLVDAGGDVLLAQTAEGAPWAPGWLGLPWAIGTVVRLGREGATRDFPQAGGFWQLPPGAGDVLLVTDAEHASKVEFLLSPTGTGARALAVRIGQDTDGRDGYLVRWSYQDQPLLAHLTVRATGPGGTTEKVVGVHHADPQTQP